MLNLNVLELCRYGHQPTQFYVRTIFSVLHGHFIDYEASIFRSTLMTTHPVGVGIYQRYNDRVIRAVLQSVVRVTVNSSHGQLVTWPTRHKVNSSQVNSSPGRLVTRSTRHKEAVNSSQANIKAVLPQQYNYPYP